MAGARAALEQLSEVLCEGLADPSQAAPQIVAAVQPLNALAKQQRWQGLLYLTTIIGRGLSDPRRAMVLDEDDLTRLLGFVVETEAYLDGIDNVNALYAGLAGSKWWPAVSEPLRAQILEQLAQPPWPLRVAPADVADDGGDAAEMAAVGVPAAAPRVPATDAPETQPERVARPATDQRADPDPDRSVGLPVEPSAAHAARDDANMDEPPLVHWVSLEEAELLLQALNEQVLPQAGQLAASLEFVEAQPVLAQLHDELALLANAFEVMALPQLHGEIERVRTNLELLQADAEGWSPERAGLLLDWGVNTVAWLAAAEAAATQQALLESVRLPDWPLENTAIDALGRELAAVRLGIDPAVKSARKLEISPEELELKVAPDVAPAVLDGMLRELPGNVGELSDRLQRLVRSGGEEDIDIARRIAHTLKGDANIVGIRGIANLTHALEDILVELKKRPHVPAPALGRALLEAGDCVAAMADHVLGRGPVPEDAYDLSQLVLYWANKALDGELEQAEAEAPQAPAMPATSSTTHAASAPAAAVSAASEAASEEPVATMAVPVPLLDSLLQLSGEAIVMTRQLEQLLKGLVAQQRDFKSGTSLFERLTAQLEDLVALRGVALQSTQLSAERLIDPLELDQYDELHTVSRRIQEIGVDQRDIASGNGRTLGLLTELLAQQDRLHGELQRKILQTRKVVVASIVPRLKRAVRQTARALLKEAELVVLGEQQEVDSDILNALVDPLMHAVRNAVDHGIEAVEERIAAGKPASGTVELRVRQDGVHVMVELNDDGRGLDLQRIRAKAEALGMISPDAELEDGEVARLILLPGFSTRELTTQISGRGIGMDVVASQVRALKGTLQIESEPGLGTRFQIRVPADLNTTQVLIVPTPKGRVAIATDRLERLVMLAPHELVERAAGTGVRYLGSVLDAAELTPLCFGGEWRAVPERANHVALLYRTEAGRLRAVLTGEVSEARTIIVSRLGQYAPSIAGVRGATILGDGRVAPVLDLPELVAARTLEAGGSKLDPRALVRNARLPRALIADDSLSVRRALEQLLRDAGFEVDAARDGLEALGVLNRHTPDVILLDLEMPKLSGLEVASFVRQTDQFKHVPVVMITSRTGDKHKQMAEEAGVDLLLTKPYSDEYLLEYLQRRLSEGRSAAVA